MALGVALSQPRLAVHVSPLAKDWTREPSKRVYSSFGNPVYTNRLGFQQSRLQTCSVGGVRQFHESHFRSLAGASVPRQPLWPASKSWVSFPAASTSSSSASTTASSSPASRGQPSQEMMDELAEFLRGDLPHLFDERGIDRSRYDDKVQFLDPITRYDSIGGYLFNIQMLRYLFSPLFQLHDVKQTAVDTLTTRWTMMMTFKLLPWQPVITFTGESIMQVNPENGKFLSHVDLWDSIQDNNYFSLEALKDLVSQMLKTYKTPDRETPKYQVLKRTSEFEVRRYEPYIVVEGSLAEGEGVSGGKGFGTIAGYIQGKNANAETISMTTPVITREPRDGSKAVVAQVVLPLQGGRESWPDPTAEGVRVTPIAGAFVGARSFGGTPTDDRVRAMEMSLRTALQRAGLRPRPGYALARYNDPRTFEFQKRNDVIIELEDYKFP